MELFKRINNNSKLAYYEINNSEMLDKTTNKPITLLQFLQMIENKDNIILQIVTDATFYIMEYINRSDAQKEELNKELEDALNTVLLKDPFGAKHNGHTLKEICDSDMEWVQFALKKMTNKFIVDKLKVIIESGIYEDRK